MMRFLVKIGKIAAVNIFVLGVIYYVICVQLRLAGDRITYDSLFSSLKSGNSSSTCVLPNLDPFNPQMMKFYEKLDPLECPGHENWVSLADGRLDEFHVKVEVEQEHGPLTCKWREVRRDGDFNIKLGPVYLDNKFVLKESDYVFVECKTNKLFGRAWSNVMAGLRSKIEKTKTESSPHLPLNVIILGFDSLSRQTVVRTLPKTLDWLQKKGSLTLLNYNVMGDGTVAALAPLLTGLKEWELPETRRRITNAKEVDVCPFIWKEYKRKGYVTSWTEDSPQSGTFTYRLTGFKNQPTDHYMRPYFQAQEQCSSKSQNLCYKGTAMHMIQYSHVKQLYLRYPNQPKFLLSWNSALGHDDTNQVQVADTDLVDLLDHLDTSGHLNNTLLIVMSDHGHRFSTVRHTLQGKLEERMPFMSLLLPPWFSSSFPSATSHLRSNVHRLSTALDVHATLKHLLQMREDVGPGERQDSQPGVHSKAVSLLREIPLDRDCVDASIEAHWCACLNWVDIPSNSTLAIDATNFLVQHINSLTQEGKYRSICQPFHLQDIVKSAAMAPKKEVLKFKKSVGRDAENVDLGDSSDLREVWVQVQVVLSPGDAVFDATVKLDIANKQFIVEGDGSVSRISVYRGQADCLEDGAMRPWCYCKQNLQH